MLILEIKYVLNIIERALTFTIIIILHFFIKLNSNFFILNNFK